jgi:hypothetical protein
LATQEPAKSQADLDRLTIKYGRMVEELVASPVWVDIIAPLFHEMVASVSGRLTDNYYHHGALTRDMSKDNALMLSGYQKGIMDTYNRITDFVREKNKVENRLKGEQVEQKVSYYNPFMEENNE